MRKYELMFIVRTDIDENDVKGVVESLKKTLTDKKAKMLEEKEDWLLFLIYSRSF